MAIRQLGAAAATAADTPTKGYVDTQIALSVQSSSQTIKDVIVLTSAAYTALGTKVSTTLYVIVG